MNHSSLSLSLDPIPAVCIYKGKHKHCLSSVRSVDTMLVLRYSVSFRRQTLHINGHDVKYDRWFGTSCRQCRVVFNSDCLKSNTDRLYCREPERGELWSPYMVSILSGLNAHGSWWSNLDKVNFRLSLLNVVNPTNRRQNFKKANQW